MCSNDKQDAQSSKSYVAKFRENLDNDQSLGPFEVWTPYVISRSSVLDHCRDSGGKSKGIIKKNFIKILPKPISFFPLWREFPYDD